MFITWDEQTIYMHILLSIVTLVTFSLSMMWKISHFLNWLKSWLLMVTGPCVRWWLVTDNQRLIHHDCRVSPANNIEHVILSCPKWGAFRIMIYEQNKKQKLPNSISSVLGDKFNHGILFTYLKAIKYFDLIWSKINNRTNLNTH